LRVNQGMVSTRSVCVRRNCFRHVGESSLEQSLNSGSVLQVVGRKVLGLRTRLGLTLLASRMLHRKAEMSPSRLVKKSWWRWTAARRGVPVWGRTKLRSSPRAGPRRSGSRVDRRISRAKWSWMRAKVRSFSTLSRASRTVWYEARSEALGEALRVARRTDCKTSSIERSQIKLMVW